MDTGAHRVWTLGMGDWRSRRPPRSERAKGLGGKATRCREYGNGYPGRRAVGGGKPEAEVGENLLNHLRLLDERDETVMIPWPGSRRS